MEDIGGYNPRKKYHAKKNESVKLLKTDGRTDGATSA